MFFYLNVLWSGCGVDEGPIEGSDSISADHPPNVLVVLVDDLGTDKVAAYGDSPTPPRTPTIDGLAADGVLFRNAWAYASCSPTRAALLTGRYGRRTGVGEVVDPATSGKYELPLSELTIPEMLAFAPDPWSTSLIGKWHLATWVSPNAELGPGLQGFEWYAATFGNLNNSSYPDAYTVEGYYNWQKDLNGALGWETRYTTTDQVDDAIARIATMPEPWFLYLPFNAPHTPSNAPPAELAEIAPGQLETQGGVYTAMLEAMDRELGRLLA
ncbi:MAG: sulfatase-like hydrolase/transferase, partial [Myxococcota bacterium]